MSWVYGLQWRQARHFNVRASVGKRNRVMQRDGDQQWAKWRSLWEKKKLFRSGGAVSRTVALEQGGPRFESWPGLSVRCLHFLPITCGLSLSFLPRSKGMQVRLIYLNALTLGRIVWVNGAFSPCDGLTASPGCIPASFPVHAGICYNSNTQVR